MTAKPDRLGGKYPAVRLRRLRRNEACRRLVRETAFHPDQLVMPYFVQEGPRCKEEIRSLPGQYRFSIDCLMEELDELTGSGVRAVLLFGIPDEGKKDESASAAWSSEGVVQKAVREIKRRFQDLLVITDVCLCAYTSHGHCGMVNDRGEISNDASLKILSDTALSHAEAGADIVAPSDMMDGRIQMIRKRLDGAGFENLPILSYSAKYASAFYGPFRDAVHSAPRPEFSSGNRRIPADRRSYQMDPANLREAMREIALDIDEGADIVMVKPAMAYLDVIREAARTFDVPLAAYAVSGEYAMIKAAAEKGIVDERQAVWETLTAFARAGARVLITYHAKQVSLWNSSTQRESVKRVTALR